MLWADADLGGRLCSWRQEALENFLEGLSLTDVGRLFQGLGLYGEAASDLFASPESL